MARPETGPRTATPRAAAPVWWVVCARELRDLWVGGKALYLILVYCAMLGLLTFLFSYNVELSLLPFKDMMLEIVKDSVAAGVGICLIIGADSVSGERERATLEGLLLAPARRGQIVLGKFLAAVSPWPVAAALAVPYVLVLSRGDPVVWQALRWGLVTGSLLAPTFAALGMLVSIRCESNKTSMIVSLGIYLALLLPAVAAFNPTVQTSAAMHTRADAFQWINPVAAATHVLSASILQQAPPSALWLWLLSPVMFGILVLVALFVFASGRLRLHAAAEPRRAPRTRVPVAPVPRPAQRPVVDEAPPPPRPLAPLRPRAGLGRVAPANSRSPAWWIVFSTDLKELWVNGKALSLLLVFTIVIGVVSFISVVNSQIDLIPAKEMVFSILQLSMYVGVLMGLIIGADALSGARERAVLEPLLLTPASRGQIMAGKFLASVSPWPAAFAISVPCVVVLAQGDPSLGPALRWFAIIGSLVVVGFTGLGMFISFWCNSNRTSLFANLTVYLLFLLPALLPGPAQKGLVGKFLQRSNPLAAADELLEKLVVNNQSLHAYGSWLKGPVVFFVLVAALLLLYAGPRLRLEAGRAGIFRAWGRLARASA
jgi:ABC-type transport system involved in multi-copper enzyme maturation permease subunit